jgi:trans-aconitate 2-methyltransferase
MLAAARKRLPRIDFLEADIATFVPRTPFDLICGNAVFQWAPDHLGVLARLCEAVAPGGVLAGQMPDNLDEPTHMLMGGMARRGPWREKFTTPIARETIPSPATYYDRLRSLAARVEIWRTTYYHPLPDHAAIVDWVRGTGLRPYLDRLEADETQAFLDEYLIRVGEAHPPLVDGRVLLRFPRIFIVAVKGIGPLGAARYVRRSTNIVSATMPARPGLPAQPVVRNTLLWVSPFLWRSAIMAKRVQWEGFWRAILEPRVGPRQPAADKAKDR